MKDRRLKKIGYSNGMNEFRFWMTEAHFRGVYRGHCEENRKRGLDFILKNVPMPKEWGAYPVEKWKCYAGYTNVELVDIDASHQFVVVWSIYDGAVVYGRSL